MKNIIYLTLFSMLFLPEISTVLRIEDLLIFILFILLLVSRKIEKKVNHVHVGIFFLYLSVILVSSLYNLQFLNESESTTGFSIANSYDPLIKEIVRVVKYSMIVFIMYNVRFKEDELNLFLRRFIYLSVCLSFIGLMQYYNTFNINWIILNYYKKDGIFGALLSDSYYQMGILRIIGTFYEPNVYAAFLIMPFALSLKFALIDNKIRYWFPVAMIGFNILLTQSRTGLIASIFCIIIYLFYLIFIKRRINIISTTVVLFVPVLMFGFVDNLGLNRIVNGLSEIFSRGVSSTNRDFVVNQIADVMTHSFWIGYSPLAQNSFPSDNELNIFIHYGGVLGIAVYVTLLIAFYRNVRVVDDPSMKLFLYAMIFCIVMVGLTNGFIMSNRVFPVFLMLYSAIVFKVRLETEIVEVKSYVKIPKIFIVAKR